MANEPISPIRYMGFNIGPNVGDNDTLLRVRVVLAGRDGNKVIGKTVNYGEPDSGDAITMRLGEKLLFPVGNVKITIQDIDRENSPGPDGYAAVSNTIWTWVQVGPSPDLELFRFLVAAARRLDTAHDLCVNALNELESYPEEEPFIKTKARVFRALGYAELMCVAFNRAVRMIKDIPSKFSVSIAVPNTVDAIFPALKDIRDALEHIEERAFEIVNARGDRHPDALTIFHQDDFSSLGILRYANHSLNIRTEVIPALIYSRQFIFQVAVEKAGAAKTINVPVEFF